MKSFSLVILSIFIKTIFSFDEVKVENNARENIQFIRRATSECAAEGETSTYCGAKKGKALCCDGLVCHYYQDWRCVKAEEGEKYCAGTNTLSKQCGSKWIEAAPKCCKNHKCVGNFCMNISTPTDKPTPMPTLSPTPIPTHSPTTKTIFKLTIEIKCLYEACKPRWFGNHAPHVEIYVSNKYLDKTTSKAVKNVLLIQKPTCWNKSFVTTFDFDKYANLYVKFIVKDQNALMGSVDISDSTKSLTIDSESSLTSDKKDCRSTRLSYGIYLS